jgi:hypothetical protein
VAAVSCSQDRDAEQAQQQQRGHEASARAAQLAAAAAAAAVEEEFADIDRIDVPIAHGASAAATRVTSGGTAAVAAGVPAAPLFPVLSHEQPAQPQQRPPLLVKKYNLEELDALVAEPPKAPGPSSTAAQRGSKAGTADAEQPRHKRSRREPSPPPAAEISPTRQLQQQHEREQQQRGDLVREQQQQQQGLGGREQQRQSPEDDEGLEIAAGQGLGRRDSPERSATEEGR